MNSFKYHLRNTATALLIGLALHGCQHQLQVTSEEESATTPGKSMSSPKRSMETTTPSRKRSAEALSYDTEEKKESPTSSVPSMADAASVSTRNTTVVITQEPAAMAAPLGQAAIVHAKAAPNDTTMVSEDTKDATMKTTDEDSQKLAADLIHWFKEFVEAVDDEEVLYKDAISAAIPRLVREGKQKGYLTKTVELPINELGWKPDCTPLHYAAAKGNLQAVEVLLREPEVVIDAKTEKNGSTPLQFAALEGRLETVRLLINAYKDMGKIKEIDAHDDERTSTLQYAALGRQENRNREVAELLEEAGADPCQMDEDVSLMDIAAMSGNLAMVEYFLERMNSRENDKSVIKSAIKSAIRLARGEEHTRIVVILQTHYEAL